MIVGGSPSSANSTASTVLVVTASTSQTRSTSCSVSRQRGFVVAPSARSAVRVVRRHIVANALCAPSRVAIERLAQELLDRVGQVGVLESVRERARPRRGSARARCARRRSFARRRARSAARCRRRSETAGRHASAAFARALRTKGSRRAAAARAFRSAGTRARSAPSARSHCSYLHKSPRAGLSFECSSPP